MNLNDFKGAPLSSLDNRELSAVTFVRDYLQLQFDGPFLNVYVWPIICLATKRLATGSPGYRDVLCGLIGQSVVAAVEEPRTKLAIHFGKDIALEISLKAEDQIGPEAAMLKDGTGQLCVVW